MRNPKDWQNKSDVSGAEQLNWSQKSGKAIRPQRPSDATVRNQVWTPGQVPQGGFRSVLNFGQASNSKISSTTKPGNAGKKSIF